MVGTDVQSESLSEGEFMRLFVKHEPVLRAYARSIFPDWDSVDDALQEASVTMWEKLGQLKDEGGFLPWAKVIVRFKCLTLITTLRRHRPLLSDGVLNQLADEAESRGADSMDSVRVALATCLTQFTNSHQELLLAPYQKGGRVKQLAEQAGKTENAFYKLLGRLREKLAACIREQMPSEAT